MNLKMIFASTLLLSTTGCVAAIPLIAQVATSGNSVAQLCSMAKVPGQSLSLCDRIQFPSMTQATPKAETRVTANASPR